MFLSPNSLIISQIRNQTIARQRIVVLNRNCNQLTHNLMISQNFHQRFGTNWKTIWDSIKEKVNERILILSYILRDQTNIYISLRARRMAQICGLYNRIYSEKTFNKLINQLMVRMRSRALTLMKKSNNKGSKDSIKYLLSAFCGVFCWESQRITDNDIKQTIEDYSSLERRAINTNVEENRPKSSFSVSAETDSNSNEENKSSDRDRNQNNDNSDNEWEAVVIRDNLRVWRKSVENTNLYEYRVFGTFHDVPARTFFAVQMDTDFRKKWDKLVLKLDVIEKEPLVVDKDENKGEDSGNEILHWVMRYPYPMNSRDYVYMRRSRIDEEQNLMVLVSKSVEHPSLPETSDHVRVYEYTSQMVIKPHNTFDDCGFDYMLTYFDDPRAAFPSPAYNWMASYGVPDFVEKLHLASVQLHYSNSHHSDKCSKNCFKDSKDNKSRVSTECIYA